MATRIGVAHPPHAVLADPESPTSAIELLPAHPHEGSVRAPEGESARVIATGISKTTGAEFALAVAFERVATRGRALAQSTFHHFASYNWDVDAGCPSFVDERPGTGMAAEPRALRNTHRYVINTALSNGR
jgi:hypothetical protein